MGKNALKVVIQNMTEAELMLGLRDGADIRVVGYFLRHGCSIRLPAGTCQLALNMERWLVWK